MQWVSSMIWGALPVGSCNDTKSQNKNNQARSLKCNVSMKKIFDQLKCLKIIPKEPLKFMYSYGEQLLLFCRKNLRANIMLAHLVQNWAFRKLPPQFSWIYQYATYQVV